MTPTARSMKLLRKSGYLVAPVERWLMIPGRHVKQDMFGCFDLFACRPATREIQLVQVTSLSNVSARVAKVKGTPELPGLLACGIRAVVHGWTKRGGRWTVKVVEINGGDLEPVVISRPPRRRMDGRYRPADLFARAHG